MYPINSGSSSGAIEFHGRGIAFPMRLGTLGLAQSAGPRKVEESIRIILGTQHGERVMRPRFGCDLKRLAFAPNNATTANLARYYVEEGLGRWEPRIELVEVVVENDQTRDALLIGVTYRLRATQDIHSLVHPFSLEGPR
ncbi:GPW/gp25 family protein [Streptomyces sp. NBC_01142]|uniref:GPW/gp25 family protein n=1 Tax=Streptomyces sp. NBC_01142 TaxID=2975865 RepID=UPI0022511BC5|nr:GPW/gp25 family protein [Streptomyces sp. NBC_01142]MCX4821037.1 GPW/gp25 family protein [Streptomyces sp. NBC_01142]